MDFLQNGILSPRHDIGKKKGRKSTNKADSDEFRKKQCQTLLQRIEDNIALEKRNMNAYQKVIQEFSHRRSALRAFYEENCKALENHILVNPNLDLTQLETLGYADELFSFLAMNFDDDKFEVDPELFSKLNLVEKTDAENRTLINILQNNMADGLTRSQRQLEILNNFVR